MNTLTELPSRRRTTIHGLGVLPFVAVAAANPATASAIAASLAPLAKTIGPIIASVKNIANKIGLGGASQDRFFDRYFSIRDAFVGAGYLQVPSAFHSNAIDSFKIRKTQIKDKGDNYTAEFERLHKWVDYILNSKNPGLGDDYRKLFPQFKMANQGNMYGAPITALKEILRVFKPGTYTPGLLPKLIGTIEYGSGAPAAGTNFVDQFEDMVTSAGKAEPGTAPGAPGGNSAQPTPPNTTASGSGLTPGESTVGMVLGVGALAAAAYFMNQKKKAS